MEEEMAGTPPLPPRGKSHLRLPGAVAFALYLLVIDALILLLLADEAPYVVPLADVLLIAAYVVDGVKKRSQGESHEPRGR
jgi:hypothetical protein